MLACERGEEGFGIIELVASMAVFGIFLMTFAAMLAASVTSQITTRNRTVAESLASQKIEEARALSYTNLGIISGSPAGTIAASASVASGGITYTVLTDVDYVNDPLPNGFQTYANYKKVTITIKKGTKQYAQLTTIVAPPTPPQLNKGVIKVSVVDYGTNQPLAGAIVSLSTGPSAPLADTTPSDGQVIFPNLTPNSGNYYDISSTLPGYTTLPDDVSPKTAAHLQVAQSQVRVTTIRMYKASSVVVNLVNPNTTPFTGSTTLAVGSSRQNATMTVTGGTTTVTSINGEDVIPGLSYTFGAQSGNTYSAVLTRTIPANYPTTTSDVVTLVMTPRTGVANLTVTVKSGSTNQTNIWVQISDGPYDLFLMGKTNGSGVVVFSLPTSSSIAYTVTFPAQGSKTLVETTVMMTSAKSVTLNV